MVTLDGTTLSNPDFGDTDTLISKRVNRLTRGGDRIVADPFVVDGRELIRYSWSAMTEKEANDVRALLKRTVGKRISFTNYNGIPGYVIIMNPETEVAQVGRERWSVSLDMQELP